MNCNCSCHQLDPFMCALCVMHHGIDDDEDDVDWDDGYDLPDEDDDDVLQVLQKKT